MSFKFDLSYDVAVAGGGIAGVAAALAAARRGAKTVLLENQVFLGGLATSGLIYIYLPLCDGKGKQVSFGITDELLRLAPEYGPFDLPEQWGGPEGGFTGGKSTRLECRFSPAGYILTLDKLLKEAGVDVFLETRICAAETASDGTVTALETENLAGRGKITAKRFVDATGDAAVVRYAGGAVETGLNYLTPWVLQHCKNAGSFVFDENIEMKAFNRSENAEPYRYNTDDPRGMTGFIRDSWELLRKYYDEAYASGISRKDLYPLHLPAMAQTRMTARICGKETLTNGSDKMTFESSVGLYGDWRIADKVWEVPYGILLPETVRGTLAAGRCISTDGDAWDAFRVIPSAALTGEISGVAAVLSIKEKQDPADLSLDLLREELRKLNYQFHYSELV